MKVRKIVFRILALAILIGIAAVMFVIGRGHTIYFDNKTLEAEDGTVYKPYYKIDVLVNGEKVAKLGEEDRGMVSTMGQKFSMELHITPKKDSKKVGSAVKLEIPYNMDGIILNLPALLNGAAEDVYMDEFIPAVVEETGDEEEVPAGDEFEMPMGDA